MTHLALRTLVAAGLLAALGNPVLAETRLGDAEIRALYSDATTEATTSRGADFVGHYRADGTMSGDVSQGKYTDVGTWEVTGGKFCRQWKQWDGGNRKCFAIERAEGGEYRSIAEGGKGTTTFRVR